MQRVWVYGETIYSAFRASISAVESGIICENDKKEELDSNGKEVLSLEEQKQKRMAEDVEIMTRNLAKNINIESGVLHTIQYFPREMEDLVKGNASLVLSEANALTASGCIEKVVLREEKYKKVIENIEKAKIHLERNSLLHLDKFYTYLSYKRVSSELFVSTALLLACLSTIPIQIENFLPKDTLFAAIKLKQHHVWISRALLCSTLSFFATKYLLLGLTKNPLYKKNIALLNCTKDEIEANYQRVFEEVKEFSMSSIFHDKQRYGPDEIMEASTIKAMQHDLESFCQARDVGQNIINEILNQLSEDFKIFWSQQASHKSQIKLKQITDDLLKTVSGENKRKQSTAYLRSTISKLIAEELDISHKVSYKDEFVLFLQDKKSADTKNREQIVDGFAKSIKLNSKIENIESLKTEYFNEQKNNKVNVIKDAFLDFILHKQEEVFKSKVSDLFRQARKSPTPYHIKAPEYAAVIEEALKGYEEQKSNAAEAKLGSDLGSNQNIMDSSHTVWYSKEDLKNVEGAKKKVHYGSDDSPKRVQKQKTFLMQRALSAEIYYSDQSVNYALGLIESVLNDVVELKDLVPHADIDLDLNELVNKLREGVELHKGATFNCLELPQGIAGNTIEVMKILHKLSCRLEDEKAKHHSIIEENESEIAGGGNNSLQSIEIESEAKTQEPKSKAGAKGKFYDKLSDLQTSLNDLTYCFENRSMECLRSRYKISRLCYINLRCYSAFAFSYCSAIFSLNYYNKVSPAATRQFISKNHHRLALYASAVAAVTAWCFMQKSVAELAEVIHIDQKLFDNSLLIEKDRGLNS